MAVKKTTAKKVAKKAPAKKAVAKKVATKKAPVKKVAAKKAVAKKAPVKKVAAKKAVATKAPVKKVTKKAAVKKAPIKKTAVMKTAVKKTAVKKTAVKKTAVKKTAVKKTAPSKVSSRVTFDALAQVPEVPSAAKNLRPIQERPARNVPLPVEATSEAAPRNEKRHRKGALLLALLLLIGSASYLYTNKKSDATGEPSSVAAPTQSAAPEETPSASPTASATAEASPVATESTAPVAASGIVTSSFTYTSTGIRLAWSVQGAEVKSVLISSAEDSNSFAPLTTLGADIRSLRIIKTDTKGWTKFRVTITPITGEAFSATLGLRGRFTL